MKSSQRMMLSIGVLRLLKLVLEDLIPLHRLVVQGTYGRNIIIILSAYAMSFVTLALLLWFLLVVLHFGLLLDLLILLLSEARSLLLHILPPVSR